MRFAAIDGLRALAILAVIYQHGYAANTINWMLAHGRRPYIIGDAWIGVTLFFVLSGFVLTLPFVDRETERLNGAGIRSFLTRRAWRLLPLFLFASAVGFAFLLPVDNLNPLLLAVTTLHMFVPTQFYPQVNGVYWSLSIEIWASVALPFMILAARRFGYLRVLLAVAAVALIVRLFACLPGFTDAEALAIRDSVLGRFDDFAAGMMLAMLFFRGHLKRTRFWMLPAAIGLIAVTCVSLDLYRYGPIHPPAAARAFANTGFTVGFSLLVAYCLSEQSLLRSILAAWPLQVIGMMTFSIYSWHEMLIRGMHGIDTPVGQVSFWLVLTILSVFTYRYIEFPGVSAVKLFRLEPQEKPDESMRELTPAAITADQRN